MSGRSGRVVMGTDGGVWLYNADTTGAPVKPTWTDINGNLQITTEDGVSTSPTDFFPIQAVQLQRFKGESWELFGDILEAESS